MTDQKIMHRSLLKAGLGEVGPAELAGGERPTFLHVAAQRTSEGLDAGVAVGAVLRRGGRFSS